MKTIIIIRHKLISWGGAELVLLKEAEYFNKLGFRVKVIVFELDREKFYDKFKLLKNVELIVIQNRNLLSQIFKLRKLFIKIKPDKIIVHENGHIHVFFSKLFLKKIPSFIHMYGNFFWLVGSDLVRSLFYRKKINKIQSMVIGHKEFQKNINKKIGILKRIKTEIHALIDFWAIRSFDKIFTCSNQIFKEINILYNREPIIIQGGVDTDFFKPLEKNINDIKLELNISLSDRIIMTVNRLDLRKRFDLLMRSFLLVSEKVTNLKLIIIGSGPEEAKIKNFIYKFNSKNKIELINFIDDELLKKYYYISEIVAYPAWSAWGLVPLEALAMNKKVVVSSDALVNEAIKNFKNVIVSDPNLKDFSSALIKSLNMPFGINRDLIVKEFDWSVYFGKLYQSIE